MLLSRCNSKETPTSKQRKPKNLQYEGAKIHYYSHEIVRERAETEGVFTVRDLNCLACSIVGSAKIRESLLGEWQKVILNDVGTHPFAHLALSFLPKDSSYCILLSNIYWLWKGCLMVCKYLLRQRMTSVTEVYTPQRENVENRGPKLKNNRIVHFALSKGDLINLSVWKTLHQKKKKRVEDWRKKGIY